jgi:uncharacterized protein YodC (DUF2158 family)
MINSYFPKFQKGDTVQLKSCGPKMTVRDYNNSLVLKCVWFNKKPNGNYCAEEKMFAEIELQ